MLWDDEGPQKKPSQRVLGADLSTASVEELKEYLDALAAERQRVETLIAQKQASRQKAHTVFKS